MMRDIPLTVVVLLAFLLGLYLMINSLTEQIIQWRYPLSTIPQMLFDETRPLGERYYSPLGNLDSAWRE